jgi:hypothetical protein
MVVQGRGLPALPVHRWREKVLMEADVKQSYPALFPVPDPASYTKAVYEDRSRRASEANLRGEANRSSVVFAPTWALSAVE